jgi:hypothetical protein
LLNLKLYAYLLFLSSSPLFSISLVWAGNEPAPSLLEEVTSADNPKSFLQSAKQLGMTVSTYCSAGNLISHGLKFVKECREVRNPYHLISNFSFAASRATDLAGYPAAANIFATVGGISTLANPETATHARQGIRLGTIDAATHVICPLAGSAISDLSPALSTLLTVVPKITQFHKTWYTVSKSAEAVRTTIVQRRPIRGISAPDRNRFIVSAKLFNHLPTSAFVICQYRGKSYRAKTPEQTENLEVKGKWVKIGKRSIFAGQGAGLAEDLREACTLTIQKETQLTGANQSPNTIRSELTLAVSEFTYVSSHYPLAFPEAVIGERQQNIKFRIDAR